MHLNSGRPCSVVPWQACFEIIFDGFHVMANGGLDRCHALGLRGVERRDLRHGLQGAAAFAMASGGLGHGAALAAPTGSPNQASSTRTR